MAPTTYHFQATKRLLELLGQRVMADAAMVAALASLLTGLLGIAVGSWLTTRRERWILRRELYTRLLEHLGEAVDTLELLYNVVLAGPGRGEKAENQWDIRIRQLTERGSRAEEEIRRVTSVATIMLSDEALMVLKSLQKGWTLSGQAESWGEHVSIRLDVAQKAYTVLVGAAKKDLFSIHGYYSRPG